MAPTNPLRNLTPTEADLDDNTYSPGKKQTLREKATRALHDPNANPSQLGDPISLKAETSDTIPKPDEAGAGRTASRSTPPSSPSSSSSRGDGLKLRERAARDLHGPGANPSQLGDPVSLKAEATDHVPTPSEQGASKDGGRAPRSRL